MKKQKLTATHDGHTFTRTTYREYTHVVLQRYSLAAELDRTAALARRYWEHNLEYHKRVAADPIQVINQTPWESLEQWKERAEAERVKAQRIIDGGPDGAAKFARGQRETELLPLLQPGKDTFYQVVGWCGRIALAQKLAGHPDRVIVPVI